MEVAITRMSQNGQIVIPAEVRRDAGLGSHSKFIVFNKGSNIFLKLVNNAELSEDIKLIERIAKSESQIKSGKIIKADTEMSEEYIDHILTA
jgi:AbrB family looped-hinge helix DNA binding protein